MKHKIFNNSVPAALSLVLCLGCSNLELVEYNKENVDPAISFMNGEDIVEIPGNIKDTTIIVKSNIWWKIADENTGDWISYSIQGQQAGETAINLSLEVNLTENDREASWDLAIDGDDSDYGKQLKLVQTVLPPSAWSDDLPGLVTSPEKGIVCPAYQNVTAMHLSSNVEWEFNSSAGWCHLSEDSDTSIGADKPIFISCDDNVSGIERSAEINIIEKSTGTTLFSFRITQADSFKAPVVKIANDENGLVAQWDNVGAEGYELSILDPAGTVLNVISLDRSAVEYDLTDFSTASNSGYIGPVDIRIRALTPSDDIYADSEPARTHSHFADNSGDGLSEDNAFRIANMRHYKNIATACTQRYYYYMLDTDLDFAGSEFPELCTLEMPFTGSFDGCGKTISNASRTIVSSEQAKVSVYAMFNAIRNADDGTRTKISGLRFENCSYTSPVNGTPKERYIGQCAGVNYGGIISDIYVSGSNIYINDGNPTAYSSGTFLWHGNILGLNSTDNNGTPGEVIGCTSDGGLIGRANYNWHNTRFYANNFYLGGIAGGNDNGCKIVNCVNRTTVSGLRVAGGITGINRGEISDSYNEATVYSGAYTGGICGLVDDFTTSAVTIEKCWNAGTIRFRQGAFEAALGGIAGMIFNDTPVNIRKCFNKGDIVDSLDLTKKYDPKNPPSTGGLLGHVGNDKKTPLLYMDDCYNSGVVEAGYINEPSGASEINRMYGGIIGYLYLKVQTDSYIHNCHSSGQLKLYTNGIGLYNYGSAFGSVSGQCGMTGLAVLENAVDLNGTANGSIVGNNGPDDNISAVNQSGFADQSNFPAWDFGSVWEMGTSYPVLKDMPGNPVQ